MKDDEKKGTVSEWEWEFFLIEHVFSTFIVQANIQGKSQAFVRNR
jgi:hypothetical protein